MIADLIAAVFHFGCAWMVSAATPATCGVAIDVPEIVSDWLPEPTRVETMFTPGALMSGMCSESGVRGPVDVNGARPVWIGVPAVIEIDCPSRWTSANP